MRKADIVPGQVYMAKVSDIYCPVRVINFLPNDAYSVRNLRTNRIITVRSARRFREEVHGYKEGTNLPRRAICKWNECTSVTVPGGDYCQTHIRMYIESEPQTVAPPSRTLRSSCKTPDCPGKAHPRHGLCGRCSGAEVLRAAGIEPHDWGKKA